jgi:hypothetical protein
MYAFYPEHFVRDMGCTPAEWCLWLPQALGERPWQWVGSDRAALHANIGSGGLNLSWHPLEPRRLGLAVLPRLSVSFSFEGVSPADRHTFMKRFDLYTQRGGG